MTESDGGMDWGSAPGQVEGRVTKDTGNPSEDDKSGWPLTSAGTIAWVVFGFIVAGFSHWVIAVVVMAGILWLNKQAELESGA